MPDNPDADKPAEKRAGGIIRVSTNMASSSSMQANPWVVRRVQESPTANPEMVEAGRKAAQALNEKEGGKEEFIDFEAPSPGPDRHVFINCPFDSDYIELFNALIYMIYDCGFLPKCAKEDPYGERFPKICQLMQDCPYGIHDLSRIESNHDPSAKSPRFNMALELGIFLGINLASGNKKKCLVMETEQDRFRQFCSNLSGFDTLAHGDDIPKLFRGVRNWLRDFLTVDIPGGEYMYERYSKEFLRELPEILKRKHLSSDPSFRDYISVVQGWVDKRRLDKTQTS